MKKVVLYIFILLSAASCKTADKLINQGKIIEAQKLCNHSIGEKRINCLTKIGYAYFNKGEFEKAAKFFDEANDLEALKKVSDRFLEKNDYENFIKYSFYSERQELLFDDFTNDLNKWSLLSTENTEMKLTKGELLLSNSDNTYIKYVSPLEFSFDFKNDFIIQTTFKRTDILKSKSAMLVWGIENQTNICAFGISDNGKYVYTKVEKGKWDNKINYTESKAINKDNGTNTLTMIKSGNKAVFYINDTYLNESVFDPGTGNKIGFLVDPGVTVELLDYRLYTIPSFSDFCQKNAHQAIKNENYDLAIYLLSKLGDTNQLFSLAQERFNDNDKETCKKSLDSMHISSGMKNVLLGDFHFMKLEYDKALEFYNLAGFSNTSNLVNTVFKDDFIDNRKDWGLGKNNYRESKIENGNFILEYFGNAAYVYNKPTPNLDNDIDFSVECIIKKSEGENNKSMQVLWGYKDIDNFHSFGANNQGEYILGEKLNGNWKTKIDWTKTNYFKKDEYNTLTVLKASSTIRCFINGYWVCDYPYEKFRGKKIGFYVGSNLTVSLDKLEVKQLAPVSFLDLISQHGNFSNSDFQKIAHYYLNRFEYLKAIEFAEKCNENSIIVQSIPYAVEELLLQDRPNEALVLCDKYSDGKATREGLINISSYLISKQKYIEAEKILKKAGHYKEVYLKLAEISDIQRNIEQRKKYNKLIGDIFFNETDYIKALEYYQIADELAGVEKIINVYISKKDFVTALDIAKKTNNSNHVKHINIARGKNLMTEKKYEEALKIFKETGNVEFEKECYIKMGDEKLAKKEYNEAESYYEMAGAQNKLKILYQTLSYDYYKKRMYSNAKIYYEKLGNVKRVKQCDLKMKSLPVKPGNWIGKHVNFIVDNDAKNISKITSLFPVRNSDKYSAIMSWDIKINNDKKFSWSTGYPDYIEIEGVFVASTKAVITIKGIYVNDKKGQVKETAYWDN